MIYALANAPETLALREDNEALAAYASALKDALIETVAQGEISGDLKGKTFDPAAETVLDMCGFLDAIEGNIETAAP